MTHPHPNHETALMLLRAVRPYNSDEGLSLWINGTMEYPLRLVSGPEILAMAAAVDAREKAMREALAAVMECRRMANIEATADRTAEDLAVCWLNGPAWDAAAALATLTGAAP